MTADTMGHCLAVDCVVTPSSTDTCASLTVDPAIEVQIACVSAVR